MEKLTLRQMQLECARALSTMQATNNNISQFNKKAHHNSQLWYKAVLEHYIKEHGGLPRDIGPAKDIVLMSEMIGT